MNFWKILKIASFVVLAIVIGVLYMASGDQSQQHNSTPSSSSSTDGSAFNGIK